MYQFINFAAIKSKKVLFIVNFFTIFVFIVTLMTGSALSNWNVYSQTNVSELQNKKIDQITLKNSKKENVDENKNEQSTVQSDSVSNNSGFNKNQNLHIAKGTQDESEYSQPDGDCLFNPSLDKCAPDIDGNCPQGFNLNENEQCFPAHESCPSGYHSHEDDETGKCIPDNVPCEPGYIMNPNFPTCESTESICQKYSNLIECKEENEATNVAYNSGYAHGCSDAKISDPPNRYINQPERGHNFHSSDFMLGYDNGFEVCTNANNKVPSNTQGSFKIIVQVTNKLPRDIYGGLTVSISHYPENIFKSAYNIYFPAGQTISKEFTFKSTDVPVGTQFEVNIDYGDDYNQYIIGVNTPIKKPEIVLFYIS